MEDENGRRLLENGNTERTQYPVKVLTSEQEGNKKQKKQNFQFAKNWPRGVSTDDDCRKVHYNDVQSSGTSCYATSVAHFI